MILKLEQQVCTLGSAKRLKEIGFPQESLFYWCEKYQSPKIIEAINRPVYGEISSAYTVAELGQLLPKSVKCRNWESYITSNGNFAIKYWDEGEIIYEDTEAEARALMLIYLKEHNLI